ncbi:MAG TPA: hypothetical protein VML01_08285 [Bryobacterales bacterium]|nr:hypothetical protein [Bryobacterales bacterium]
MRRVGRLDNPFHETRITPTLTPIIAVYVGWEGSLHFASFVVALSMVIWFFIKPKSDSQGATL